MTAVAVFGLANELDVLDLPFEGIDLAIGDHDGDGSSEVFVLDPRQERIFALALPAANRVPGRSHW
jgi:hypothetical protein